MNKKDALKAIKSQIDLAKKTYYLSWIMQTMNVIEHIYEKTPDIADKRSKRFYGMLSPYQSESKRIEIGIEALENIATEIRNYGLPKPVKKELSFIDWVKHTHTIVLLSTTLLGAIVLWVNTYIQKSQDSKGIEKIIDTYIQKKEAKRKDSLKLNLE